MSRRFESSELLPRFLKSQKKTWFTYDLDVLPGTCSESTEPNFFLELDDGRRTKGNVTGGPGDRDPERGLGMVIQ